MESLNLITFASVLAKQETNAIKASHKELISTLEQDFTVNIIFGQNLQELPQQGLNLIFIATGGTEGMVVKNYSHLPHPMIILTDGKANSLAASLELSNWVRNQNDKCTILHGPLSLIVKQLKSILLKQKLIGKRIGMIGQPSDWLVASDVDYKAAQERWGVQYIDVPITKVEEYYAQTTDSQAEPISNNLLAKAAGCKEPNKEEILKAARLYLAVKRIAQEWKLDALTLECFRLIPTTCTTGCLALALLNDEGIVAGCEGDLQTVFTMLLVKTITGKGTFMANPAYIDTEKNEIILAHCTIGLKQTKSYIVRSHFESQSGVAIQGILPEDAVTIVKVGGKNLDQSIVLEGRIVENQDDSRKCRTQIRVALDQTTSPACYFLNGSIGNHHVVVQGNFTKLLKSIL